MSRRLINMRLPLDLLGRTDAEAERLGQTRTKFVERALEKALDTTVGGVTASESPAGAGSASPRASKGQPVQSGHLPTCRCPMCSPKKS